MEVCTGEKHANMSNVLRHFTEMCSFMFNGVGGFKDFRLNVNLFLMLNIVLTVK